VSSFDSYVLLIPFPVRCMNDDNVDNDGRDDDNDYEKKKCDNTIFENFSHTCEHINALFYKRCDSVLLPLFFY
jgi:hypothetical protein